MAAASLAGISIPIHLVDLGSPGVIPLGFSAADLAPAIPRAYYDAVPEATQFDAFSLCTLQGAAILHEGGETKPCARSWAVPHASRSMRGFWR
jgi:hypothetical protein